MGDGGVGGCSEQVGSWQFAEHRARGAAEGAPWRVDLCGLWTADCGLWTADCGLRVGTCLEALCHTLFTTTLVFLLPTAEMSVSSCAVLPLGL